MPQPSSARKLSDKIDLARARAILSAVKFASLVFHLPAAVELSVQDVLCLLSWPASRSRGICAGRLHFQEMIRLTPAELPIQKGHLDTASALLSSVRGILPAKTLLLS